MDLSSGFGECPKWGKFTLVSILRPGGDAINSTPYVQVKCVDYGFENYWLNERKRG